MTHDLNNEQKFNNMSNQNNPQPQDRPNSQSNPQIGHERGTGPRTPSKRSK